MKILFVFTGGTIGSAVKNGVADVDRDVSNKTGQTCLGIGDTADYAFPYNILSENSLCSTLSDILTYMLSVDIEKYDGIIITHGSDTLAYTSSLLGLAMSWADIPIVITAANYVPTDPRSNAFENLKAACDLIKTVKSGVYVVWKNVGERVHAHKAVRLLEADDLDRFTSRGGRPAGVYDGKWEIFDSFAPCGDLKFLKGQKINMTGNVILLHSYVGLDFGAIDLKNKSAVLLKLYHSGTACMAGGSCSFNYLADMCKRKDVDLYITPIKDSNYIYSSAKGLADHAIPMKGMSEIAAYTRLLLAYSLDGTQRERILRADVF